jgi:eukaryotic-like serine/threonine-protein kinase
LGATFIALITKQHPADLPQKDLQIEFEQITQLSPGFTNWLKWMTHPSLERRPASVQIAKEALEKPQQIKKYSQPLKQGKNLNTASLLGNAIGRSTAAGTIAIGICTAIYRIFLYPDWETIIEGFCLGFSLGLGNGIMMGVVTRLWFLPLTNPKLYRQVLTAISIVLCTSTSIFFFFFKMIANMRVYEGRYIFYESEIIFDILAP